MKMMKKITLIFMSLSLILSLGIASASPTKIYVDPSSIAGLNPGQTFTIDIKVDDITNLYGFEFKLGYDTSVLDAQQITIGFLNEPLNQIRRKIDDPNGLVWLAITSESPANPVSGDGTLATITFKVTSQGTSALDLYHNVLGDSYGNAIGHDVNDGYYGSVSLGIMDSVLQFFRNIFGRFLLVMR